jgi:hypothetical protein
VIGTLIDETQNVTLKCKDTQIEREYFLNNKWLNINEEIVQKKTTELKSLGKFLYTKKCKWENQVAKTVQNLDEEGEKEL